MGVMDSYSLGEFCRCKRFLLQNLRGRLHLSMSKRQLDRIDYVPRVAGFSLNDSKCLTKRELAM